MAKKTITTPKTLVEIDNENETIFARFDSGTSISVDKWDRKGDTSHLLDGQTEHYDDGCTATRVGPYVIWFDPDLLSNHAPGR